MASVDCNRIQNIIWNFVAEPDRYILLNDVHIWNIVISSNLNLIDQYSNVLSADELERAMRYHHEKDRHRFLISRILLRFLISKYSNNLPEEIQFREGLNKKPFVESFNNEKLNYNVSHSGDKILIAISKSETGVDIEKLDDNFYYKEILTSGFSIEETRFIENEAKPAEIFYLLWAP